ncbi:MAG: glycosyltransferase [Planctomycetota bacterium]
MKPPPAPDLSIVIVTRDRREALRRTLDHVARLPDLSQFMLDVWVVDNGSRDGAADLAQAHALAPSVVRLPENQGVAARNHAIKRAGGRHIALLDDDSWPDPGSLCHAVERLDAEPDLAAVTGPVRLTAGGLESCGLPTVPILCGVVLRASALREAGGIHPGFVRQAEEYPLALRLYDAGLRIARDPRVTFVHDKPSAPLTAERLELDLRHNLAWMRAMLPPAFAEPYVQDTRLRYRLLAEHTAPSDAAGLHPLDLASEQAARGLTPVGRRAVEALLENRRIASTVADWAHRLRIRRPALLGYGKNLYAFTSACRREGLDPPAVFDDRPAFVGSTYRGLPVRAVAHLPESGCDAVVISETAPARIGHVQHLAETLAPGLPCFQPSDAHDRTRAHRSAAA